MTSLCLTQIFALSPTDRGAAKTELLKRMKQIRYHVGLRSDTWMSCTPLTLSRSLSPVELTHQVSTGIVIFRFLGQTIWDKERWESWHFWEDLSKETHSCEHSVGRHCSGHLHDTTGGLRRNLRGVSARSAVVEDFSSGGLEHGFYDFPYIGKNHHPNWRTHIFQRGRSTTNQYCISFQLPVTNCHRWWTPGPRTLWTLRKGMPMAKKSGCWDGMLGFPRCY